MITVKDGLAIVLCGGEGSGKSTQAKILVEILQREGYDVLLTCEPGAPQSEKCLEIRERFLHSGGLPPEEQLALVCEDRGIHVPEVILPALMDGKIVICDRFSDSSFAYQYFAGGIPLEDIRKLDEEARQGFIPDLTILLDIPAKRGLERTMKAGKRLTDMDKLPLGYHEKVNQGFRKIARTPEKFGLGEHVIMNAQKRPDDLAVEILRLIHQEIDMRR